ncbi:MAG: hypothetical protein WC043_09675 [Pseudobdellovibrionaceae bacterium]
MNNTEEQTKRNIFTVRQFCDRNPAFTPGGIRHLIFYSDKNGFSTSFKRIGRRVYIDETQFFKCVDKAN